MLGTVSVKMFRILRKILVTKISSSRLLQTTISGDVLLLSSSSFVIPSFPLVFFQRLYSCVIFGTCIIYIIICLCGCTCTGLSNLPMAVSTHLTDAIFLSWKQIYYPSWMLIQMFIIISQFYSDWWSQNCQLTLVGQNRRSRWLHSFVL